MTAMELFSETQLSEPPFSQAHMFEGLSAEQKQGIIRDLDELDGKLPGGGLKGYLERARTLLADAKSGKNPFEGLKPEVPSGEAWNSSARHAFALWPVVLVSG
ncbi:USP [Symbiodinium sp. CCMP2456]|nr:USP [Symbiodinium sp. CCMP2456]